VKLLVARGADVNHAERTRGQTALMWAVSGRHLAVVRTLVEVGASISAKSLSRKMLVNTGKDGLTRLSGDYTDLYDEAQGGFTPLLFAVRQGDVECATLLLNAGASLEETTPNGASALVVATHSGRWPMASMLLERGANPNADGAGYTAVHAALARDNVDFAKALLKKGADVNARIRQSTPVRRFGTDFAIDPTWIGGNAFWMAARFANAALMRELLAMGADPNVVSRHGATALVAAATGARRPGGRMGGGVAEVEKAVLEAAQVALETGIDVNATDDAGDTALHIASARRLNAVIEFLAARGATVVLRNKERATPLSLASIDYSTYTAVQLGYVKYRALRADGSTAAMLRTLGATE
jgi:ankyrin repeat protein